jgi:hypothetical protein
MHRTGELRAEVDSPEAKNGDLHRLNHVSDRNGAHFHTYGRRCPHYRIVYVCHPCAGRDGDCDVHAEANRPGKGTDDHLGSP